MSREDKRPTHFDLSGRAALITGGSSGIGKAIAVAFADAGADVCITYHSREEGANEAVEAIRARGRKALAIRANAEKEDEINASVERALAEFGKVDILINNAGALLERKLIEFTETELWNRTIALNLTSVFLYSRAMIGHLKQLGWGRIVNMTSIAARNGGGVGAGPYAAAKAGVSTLTRNLAKELAGSGVTVNGIAPGVIDTPFHSRTPDDVKSRFLASIPLGRFGVAEDVVGAALYLCSDLASYVTGEIIEVNGGQLMD